MKPENARKTFDYLFAQNAYNLGVKLARNLYALCCKSLTVNDLGHTPPGRICVNPW